jgi:aspartate/methionine/tyrosine aminotransferase
MAKDEAAGPEPAGDRKARAPAARSEIASFIVMDVMRTAAELESLGRSIIHMEVGQPGTPAPETALAAANAALTTETLGYTPALGIDALRHRIARSYRERYGIDIEDNRIVICTGSSAAFILAFLALFDAGARVALPSPGYPCYRHILTALGCRSPLIETGSGDAMDADARCRGGASSRRGPERPFDRKPGQSDRHDDRA